MRTSPNVTKKKYGRNSLKGFPGTFFIVFCSHRRQNKFKRRDAVRSPFVYVFPLMDPFRANMQPGRLMHKCSCDGTSHLFVKGSGMKEHLL